MVWDIFRGVREAFLFTYELRKQVQMAVYCECRIRNIIGLYMTDDVAPRAKGATRGESRNAKDLVEHKDGLPLLPVT